MKKSGIRILVLMMAVVVMAQWCEAGVRTASQKRAAASEVLGKSKPVGLLSRHDRFDVYGRSGGGFAIISNDENCPAVLAYSPQGEFDEENGNPGFKWWLRSINKAMLRETTKPDATRFARSVAPLISTKWGQDEPFRYMCPFMNYEPDLSRYGIYIPDSTHNAVGCGPAAMAQLMNYYQHPKRGTGSRSVTVRYDQADVVLSVDFGATAYDWDNMLDDYSGEYTQEQGQAVAQLCYHAAVAAQAKWSSLGGATFDENIVKALIEHFGYNDTAHVINRPLYDEPTWMEMIYGMLSAGQPILYSGKDINFEVGILVGHNFIIDGYDENGLVHVNWGWQGRQDGYYDIATLSVGKLSFDDWQGMYVGLYPSRAAQAGDINGDNEVDIADVVALIEAVLHGQDGQDITVMDINGDTTVDIADVTLLIAMILAH